MEESFPEEDIVFELSSENGTACFTGKIRGLRRKGPLRPTADGGGNVRWVTVENCQWAFEEKEMTEWLGKYGTLMNQISEKQHQFADSEDNGEPLRTGHLSVKMEILKPIPQFLPIRGRKIRIYYRGIVRMCVNCYEEGHIKANCKNERKTWLEYVDQFVIGSGFDKEMFGNWIRILQLEKNQKERAEHRKNLIEDVRKQARGDRTSDLDKDSEVNSDSRPRDASGGVSQEGRQTERTKTTNPSEDTGMRNNKKAMAETEGARQERKETEQGRPGNETPDMQEKAATYPKEVQRLSTTKQTIGKQGMTGNGQRVERSAMREQQSGWRGHRSHSHTEDQHGSV